jgi:5,10-methylenetetrahydromethanopterin reductase
MKLSCAFATSVNTPEHVRIAEELGYQRAWLYDSPALYADVWMMLALAAERTSTIGIGPGVMVPSLRHPMTNAAAIATLSHMAPGRVGVAIGAGFTGRYVLGQRPMRWSDVADYVRALRGLLAGEEVTWDGSVLKMIHPPGFVAPRPIHIPILIGAEGPKGFAVASELGDGVMGSTPVVDAPAGLWRVTVGGGTVIGENESANDERVLQAAGHGIALLYHAVYEHQGADAVDGFPGGKAWRTALEDVEPERRHLSTHENHLVSLSDRDREALREGWPALMSMSFTGSAGELRERLAGLEASGVTDFAYQPAGPDIPGELERMMVAIG